MQQLPISIQRAMIRRHALSMLGPVVTVAGFALNTWGPMLVALGFAWLVYLNVTSPFARRTKRLCKEHGLAQSYVKHVENLVSTFLVIALPCAALVLFVAGHWFQVSGATIDKLMYPFIIMMSVVTAVVFFVLQLPSNQSKQAFYARFAENNDEA